MSNKKGISIEKDCLKFIPFWFLFLASFDVFKALKHNLMRHEFQMFWFLPYKLTFYCKLFTKYFKKYSKSVAFSDDLEPFEFKIFPLPLAPIMVGLACDAKLSAFWKMCFSKPPHFGNHGVAPQVNTHVHQDLQKPS